MSTKHVFATAVLVLIMSGCSTIAGKSNSLTDERVRSESAGALGYDPDELTIESRRTEGTNTYVNLTAKDGKQFSCIINGGNILTLGMTNPPMCNKKGEPIKGNLLQR